MTTNITLTSRDILEYQTFAIFGSRRARNMANLNTFGVFAEIMIAFFVLDMIFGTKFLTLIGIIGGILWLVFYPKFLRKKRINILKSIDEDTISKQMTLEINDEWFSFYDQAPEHKFSYQDIDEIYQTAKIFIIFVGALHIILPLHANDAVADIAKRAKKHILKFENMSYERALDGKI